MASKLIVLGAVNGQLQSAFTKLSTLHTKNNFSFAIVVGDLFAEDDDSVFELLAGSIAVPLPTYFTVGTRPLPAQIVEKIEKDEEICPNLHFLGKRSTTKTSEGVRIVALGGQLDETIVGGTSQEQHLPFHTVGDAKALHGANTADILLTACWPASIRTGSKVVIPVGSTLPPKGQEYISDLCATLKPRYHFSASPDFFYEREPFFHPATKEAPDVRPLTRFISLAPYGNPTKAKAIYAFSLQHSPDWSAPFPAGTTSSPFTSNSTPKKRAALDPEPYSRTDSYKPKRHKGAHGGRRPPPGPGECFFCLSNPTLATHLISSIGDDAYLTIAKGPLTTAETNAALGIDFPAHALIIPLTHSPTLALITEEDNARQKTFAEMTKFREALQTMVAKRSKGKLGAVTYEISKANGVHTHWQFVPMPIETIQKGLVEAAFRVEAENLKYPDFQVRDPGIGQDDGDFFRVWVWTSPSEEGAKGTTKCLTMAFDDYLRFSLQFGRIVLAKLLGLEKRIQWRDCAQTEDEEKKDIEAFKTAFKEYDFTLD